MGTPPEWEGRVAALWVGNLKKSTSSPHDLGEGVARRRRRHGGRKSGGKKATDLLTAGEVSLLRDLFETGFWSVDALAEKFEISKGKTRSIVDYNQAQ